MDEQPIIYRHRETRVILRRTLIYGTLELLSPTLISNGDSDLPTDMALLRDAAEGKALLPGSSIAGALRAYLAQFNHSDARQHFLQHLSPELKRYLSDNNKTLITGEQHVFGATMTSDNSDGDQSAILISDAISSDIPTVDVRDGVRIESSTRTASDSAKYDLEVLRTGTTFTLKVELIEEVPFDADKRPLWADVEAFNTERRRLLAQALHGLEDGSITLGMRKQRGLGACKVTQWQVWDFAMTTPDEMLAWLQFDASAPAKTGTSISTLLGFTRTDNGSTDCTITATFGLDQSLLVRSASDQQYTPDDVFLTTTSVKGVAQPVIPGTSWAGVIRHRAEKIVNTLRVATVDVNTLFGFVDEVSRQAQRSRIRIGDSIIEHASTDYVQTRIAIDRFTGGPYPGALLVEQPVWGTETSSIELKIRLSPPYKKSTDQQEHSRDMLDHVQMRRDIGLLLLVIKDLWLGDLPVGGEQSIGRGTLRGKTLELTWDGKTSIITQNLDQPILDIDDQHGLQSFVDALNEVKR